MGVMDYFKPVSTWTTEKVREFIRENDDGTYNLVDVRQSGEYEKGHLPGARLIPVGQLGERVAELDADRITIVYCAAGVRSRAAASILDRAGFPEVYSMAGGINAWHGLVAEGFPEAGIASYSAASSVNEVTALAWVLEDGTQMFYEKMAETTADRNAALLFRELVTAEEGHKAMIAGLHHGISGTGGASVYASILGGNPQEKIMEGGMRVNDAVAWADRKGVREILELSVSLEASSYDRYRILQGLSTDEKTRNVFKALADEEKHHLGMLTELFERKL